MVSVRALKLLGLFFIAGTIPRKTEASHKRAPRAHTGKRVTCTVNSVSSASDLSGCTSVVIESFTVPSGNTLNIAAAKGASITQNGDITFDKTTASGPLFTIDTDDVHYNGNNHHISGNGQLYWDGQGGSNKPHPFINLRGYGTFEHFTVLNSPANAISVGTRAPTTIQYVTVDNSAGDKLARNTDGFDISANDVTLRYDVVTNQDDCVAINRGRNILIQNCTCNSGHGISIGSIASGNTVSNVLIQSNTVTDSQQGFRIKVDAKATNALVSEVTYDGNTASGLSDYGLLITQSYPKAYDKPGTGSSIRNISFGSSLNSISVLPSAYGVGVNCGNCDGTWDFNALAVAGGQGNKIQMGGAQPLGLS